MSTKSLLLTALLVVAACQSTMQEPAPEPAKKAVAETVPVGARIEAFGAT